MSEIEYTNIGFENHEEANLSEKLKVFRSPTKMKNIRHEGMEYNGHAKDIFLEENFLTNIPFDHYPILNTLKCLVSLGDSTKTENGRKKYANPVLYSANTDYLDNLFRYGRLYLKRNTTNTFVFSPVLPGPGAKYSALFFVFCEYLPQKMFKRVYRAFKITINGIDIRLFNIEFNVNDLVTFVELFNEFEPQFSEEINHQYGSDIILNDNKRFTLMPVEFSAYEVTKPENSGYFNLCFWMENR